MNTWSKLLLLLVVGSIVSVSVSVSENDLPSDPAKRCAVKALRGEFGQIEEWQRQGYLCIANSKVVYYSRVWVTTYYPSEGFRRGEKTRWGMGCSERVAASNKLPPRTYVLIPVRNGYTLRQIWDTGAKKNDIIAIRKGGDFWIDVWEERKGKTFGNDVGDNAGIIKVAWVAK